MTRAETQPWSLGRVRQTTQTEITAKPLDQANWQLFYSRKWGRQTGNRARETCPWLVIVARVRWVGHVTSYLGTLSNSSSNILAQRLGDRPRTREKWRIWMTH